MGRAWFPRGIGIRTSVELILYWGDDGVLVAYWYRPTPVSQLPSGTAAARSRDDELLGPRVQALHDVAHVGDNIEAGRVGVVGDGVLVDH